MEILAHLLQALSLSNYFQSHKNLLRFLILEITVQIVEQELRNNLGNSVQVADQKSKPYYTKNPREILGL
jgi:hypothetical protein